MADFLDGRKAKIRGTICVYQGTYIWIEVDDLKKLEDKLVCGPYVHHCTGIYEDILPQVFEACKYIEGLTPDPYDCDNEVLKALVRGEK